MPNTLKWVFDQVMSRAEVKRGENDEEPEAAVILAEEGGQV